MAESAEALEAVYRTVRQQSLGLMKTYMKSSHRASTSDAEVNVRALCLRAHSRTVDALRNYNARCAQPGTWQTTIERARSEFFTCAWDEVAKMLDWCTLRDAEHGSDNARRLEELRNAAFTAKWNELMALHAWWVARDDERLLGRLGPEGREDYMRNRHAGRR